MDMSLSQPNLKCLTIGVIFMDPQQLVTFRKQVIQPSNMEFGLIEDFIGREKDIMVICTSTHLPIPTAVYRDEELCHSALTRAKKHVVILGHNKTLQIIQFWRFFLFEYSLTQWHQFFNYGDKTKPIPLLMPWPTSTLIILIILLS